MNVTLVTVLIILAVGLPLALVYGNLRWQSATTKLEASLEAARLPFHAMGFSANELALLPAPVQRYFRAALVDGLRMVAGVAIEQTGTFNQSETTAAWKPFTATQRAITRPPGYFWDAHIRMWPGVPVRVRDAYVAGEGILQAAVFGLFPVANLRDSGELAKGELMRYLAEAAWYPTALLPNQGVRWETVDDDSARATLTDGAITVSLLFRFNVDHLIASVRAEERGRMVGANLESMPWEGRFWNYAVRNGLRVPLEGEVAWIHPEGPKPYWRGRITRLDHKFAP
jgi:hypothetical protein